MRNVSNVERYTTWESVPDHLATKTQLSRDGLKLASDQKPVAIKTGGYGPYSLYDRRMAVPKRKTTEAQKVAAVRNLEKARAALYCAECGAYGERLDKDGRCRDCRHRHLLYLESQAARASLAALAESDSWLVLDTETTDLDQTAEIVQIGIVDAAGRVLMNQLIRPSGAISPETTAVHGLDTAALAGAPTWPDVFQEIEQLLAGRQVLAYNAEFDQSMIQQTCRRYGLAVPAIQEWTCIMELYAAYWAEIRGDGFRLQSLGKACSQQGIRQLGLAHDAAGDAMLTWQLVKCFADKL